MSEVEKYGSRLRCIKDRDKLVLWGNYQTTEASNVMVVFEKCDPAKSQIPCKSKTEIDDWMFSKYFLVLINEKKFVSHKFDK